MFQSIFQKPTSMTKTLDEFRLLYNSLFEEIQFKKGEYFVKKDMFNNKLGILSQGLMRGYSSNEEGDDVNLLFFIENDIISGNPVPNMPSAINIQAIQDCIVWVANYSMIIEITKHNGAYNSLFNSYVNHVHSRIQKRLVSLIDYNALDRYRFFLKEYPNLINRIPHYLVANFLGITATQLSRVRKEYAHMKT